MRVPSINYLAFLGLSGLLYGCAPTGPSASGTQSEIELASGPGPLAPPEPGSEPAQASRPSGAGKARSAPAGRPSSAGQAGAQKNAATPEDTDALGAEWTMTVQPDATIRVQHRGADVVRPQYISWAEKSLWVASTYKAQNVHAGNAILSADIPKLNLHANGEIRHLAENELRVDYQFKADKGHSGIFGATLQWSLQLKSPSFEGKFSDPIILEDKTGWSWPVGPNQMITVKFDRPLEKIYFEQGHKHEIRAFFFAEKLDVGQTLISYTVRLPDSGRVVPSAEERYGSPDTKGWFRDALSWDGSPVDLSFLNAQDRPAGGHGNLKAEGDRFVFADGTPARFWGANLSAKALFETPHETVPRQAHRMAQLGYNLMRIVQHDAPWCIPNIFAAKSGNTRHLDPKALESLDWWIKCLKNEGIYVWLDMIYARTITPADGVTIGFDEIKRNRNGMVWGFNYFNDELRDLMQEFQHQYLSHVNRYTGLAYKDDPVVVGIQITNENDLTQHNGVIMLPDKKNPVHNALFTKALRAYARQTGLPEGKLIRTWEPGPNKLFLNEMEHRFNRFMIDDLRNMGVRALLATTNFWGRSALYSLPALTEGDVIDVHSYGGSEDLSTNTRYAANFVAWVGAAKVQGKPLSTTEWNVEYPAVDRFTAPLYMAGIASLQGWDMPMIFSYGQFAFKAPGKASYERKVDKWSTCYDPSITGVMPAAALAFRRGHISPARNNICLMLSPEQLLDRVLSPNTAAALRTIVEQSRFSIGLPVVKELDWLKPTEVPSGTTIVNDPDHDFIPTGQSFVRSDTGELLRNWKFGIELIDSPKTQAVIGWIGGKSLKTKDATFQFSTRKATVALTSLDDQPLSSSGTILITAMGRAVASNGNELPFLSEPIVGSITLNNKTAGLELVALGPSGAVQERQTPQSDPDGLTIWLPTRRGTHWYILRTVERLKKGND